MLPEKKNELTGYLEKSAKSLKVMVHEGSINNPA